MPKTDRYSLGQNIDGLLLEIMELLFAANAMNDGRKLETLNLIDLKLKILKTLVRLAFDSQAINENKYLILIENILEIGRMLGGWLKEIRKQNPA